MSDYPTRYDPSVLVGISRGTGRQALGLSGELPFDGVDLWNAYELSWLNERGKPQVATAELWIPAGSPQLVESKSLKLYLNSLNGERHASAADVRELIRADVSAVLGSELKVELSFGASRAGSAIDPPTGHCIDDADIDIEVYSVDPELLAGSVSAAADDDEVDETLYSQLLKSNCPVTGQPDWATVTIHYRGRPIDRSALLRYIVSYRNHDEFHEQCVERIFADIKERCGPRSLSVLGRYTRRGGLDINPFRSDFESLAVNIKAWRQ